MLLTLFWSFSLLLLCLFCFRLRGGLKKNIITFTWLTKWHKQVSSKKTKLAVVKNTFLSGRDGLESILYDGVLKYCTTFILIPCQRKYNQSEYWEAVVYSMVLHPSFPSCTVLCPGFEPRLRNKFPGLRNSNEPFHSQDLQNIHFPYCLLYILYFITQV